MGIETKNDFYLNNKIFNIKELLIYNITKKCQLKKVKTNQ